MEDKETIDDTLTLKAGIPVITAQSFRLKKIRDIQNVIEEERNKRATLSKNYNKAVKIIKTTTDILGLITMALGVSGIGVLSTVVSAPIAIGMEGIALAAGVIIIIASQVNKKISFKGEKHEKIKVLAEAKINTISDLISKALEDGEISNTL